MTTVEAVGITAGEVREIIRQFIQGAVRAKNLDPAEDLFESGIVNSLFAVQLMTFLEQRFRIEVGSDDLEMDNFRSLDAATAFVVRKVRAAC